MWDAVSGGEQIQSIALQGSGGIPTNQIDSVSVPEKDPFDFDYDAAGNVIGDDLSGHTYSYDSENRLVSVDGGSTASYAFDHQNRRYKKTVGSTVTHYVWQGYQVLAEHNGSSGAVLWDYVFAGSRMIGKVAGSTVNYFLSDRLSVRLTMSSNGSVVGRQAHAPFGEDFAESGTQEKNHFTTYVRDSESGLDYAINRGFSPPVARFQSSDPWGPSASIGSPQSWNRYSYTQNDPINLTDPLGLWIRSIVMIKPGCWAYNHREEPIGGEAYEWTELVGSGCDDSDDGGTGREETESHPSQAKWTEERCNEEMSNLESEQKDARDSINGVFDAFVEPERFHHAFRLTLEAGESNVLNGRRGRAARSFKQYGRSTARLLADLMKGRLTIPFLVEAAISAASHGLVLIGKTNTMAATLKVACGDVLTGDAKKRLDQLTGSDQLRLNLFYRNFFRPIARLRGVPV
jgi:RHS repeat-associated protein